MTERAAPEGPFLTGYLLDIIRGLETSAQPHGIDGYCHSLSRAAEDAESERPEEAKKLRALAGACSMMLSRAERGVPFRPLAQSAGRRSALPEDFESSDLALFRHAAEVVADYDLKARLWDVIWLREKDAKAAQRAIEAYMIVAEGEHLQHHHDRIERVIRALELALQLRLTSRPRDRLIRRALNVATVSRRAGKAALSIALFDFLATPGLMDPQKLLAAMTKVTGGIDTVEPFEPRRALLGLAARLHYRRKDATAAKRAVISAAESLLVEAKSATAPLLETHFLERALHTLRGVRNYRAHPEIVERIETLKSRLMELRDGVMEQLQPITGPSIPLKTLIEHAISAVSGRSPKNAILGIATLVESPNYESICRGADTALKHSVVSRLFSTQRLGADGRTVAKIPAGALGEIDASELRHQMCQNAMIHRQIVVAGSLMPALETLAHEHYFVDRDLAWLFDANPLVPHGREVILMQGLLAGLRGDFLTSVSLLLPQIEHLFRFQLNARNVVTTKFDKNGVEDQIALEDLISLAERHGLVDQSIAFDIGSLLIDRAGPNLRNEHSHGLLTTEAYYSAPTIYMWGFVLRWLCWRELAMKRVDDPAGGTTTTAPAQS